MSCFIRTGRDCPTASSQTQRVCYCCSTVASTEPSGSTPTAALGPLRLSSTLSAWAGKLGDLPRRSPLLSLYNHMAQKPTSLAAPHASPQLSRGPCIKLTVTQLSKGMLEAGGISNRTLNSHPALAAGQHCQKMPRWLKSWLLQLPLAREQIRASLRTRNSWMRTGMPSTSLESFSHSPARLHWQLNLPGHSQERATRASASFLTLSP